MADCNWGAFQAEDILKYGYMMIKRPPTSTKVRIKAWQSKFFVLRDKTRSVPQRLEYYKDDSAFEFQKTVEHSFYLDSIVYIGETCSSKSHCYPIMVVCSKQGAFTLACDSKEATKDWIQALNTVAVKINGDGSPNMWIGSSVDDSPATTPELTRHAWYDFSAAPVGSLQNSEEQVPQGKLTRSKTISSTTTTKPTGYFVTIRLTPQSEKNHLRGDYILCITEGEVVVQSVDGSQTIVSWPVSHLRSFKSEPAVSAGVKDMQLLTLNAGSRSATGEGIFQFFTRHGDTIADEIRLRSQHAFKTAAQKREAFRTRSSTGSDAKSPPSVHPAKRLPTRAMTAPPEKLANVLTKKDRGVPRESLKRFRADTVPCTDQKVEQNGPTVNGTDNESSSSSEVRPRSATDSSMGKTSDDEVFLKEPAYCEINNEDSGIIEEADVSAYIDLLSDDTAEPIHISDPVPSRKISSESQASSCSLTSEEGSMRVSSLPRKFSSSQFISEENEMDSEGYIKCEALQTGPEENIVDKNGNNVDFFVSENLAEMCAMPNPQLPSCAVDGDTLKSESQLSSSSASINRKLREHLLAQMRDLTAGTHPPKSKLERERALMSENLLPPTSKADEDDSLSPADSVDSGQALLEKARDPEASKKLLDQIIAQMEKPQQHDVRELFPSRKRNSIGAVNMETAREAQQKMNGRGSHSQSFSAKKHSVIEKTRSTCEGFFPREHSPGPPPLPNRPDSVEVPRRRVSSSVGDISEDLHKRPDLIGAHRSTFIFKGMSVNPQTLSTPLRNTITGHLGGEAAIHARLIEKTEIRDELAQSSTAKNKAAAENSSVCLIANGGATCPVGNETIVNNTNSLECRVKSQENIDEDGHGEMARRKDSKASNFMKKVWKLAPKPRRETSEEPSAPSERPRRESLSPGDAVDLQGRFSGSEPNTPESSPKMGRKNSKTSPKNVRKISSDEKVKKDKDSSASKKLRKVSKGDSKKDESCRKISREESPKKDVTAADGATQPLPLQHNKTASPEKNRKDLKTETTQESHESELTDSFQSGPASNIFESRHAPTDDDVKDPAPALPPRKKFEPPPLPPRIYKSSPSPTLVSPSAHSSPPHHGARAPQPPASTSREGRRHSSCGRRSSGGGPKEEFLPPPPVPPRNSQSPEPKKVPSSERSAARAPVIQLTCSSPENRDDALEKRNSDSEEDVANMTTGEASEQNPPIISASHQSTESLSHPVPHRPPKGQRTIQAKDFFRSRASHNVIVPSSDSDGGEMDDTDFQPQSPRYGNIDEIRMAIKASEEEEMEGDLAEQHASTVETQPHAHDSTEGDRTKSPVNLNSEELRVMKSQRETMRLKINLMKESSVDDIQCESEDAEDLGEQSKPKRPSTPLSIRRNVFTLSSVSIN